MKFAWSDARLEQRCGARHQLARATGDLAEVAEDLLALVARAPRLSALLTFRSIKTAVTAGQMVFSLEEVDMHTRPLGPNGEPFAIADRAALPDHGSCDALVVDDFQVRGRSVMDRAS